MVFSRVWATGISNGSPADGAKLTQLDINVSRALDGAAGGKNSPTAPLIVSGTGGFQVSDANEFAPFNVANSKWLAAAMDFSLAKDTISVGGVNDAAASLAIEGAFVCVDDAGNDNLYTSFDDGLSWKKKVTAAAFPLKAVACGTVGGNGGNSIVTGVSSTVYYSTDDFASFISAGAMPGTPTSITVAHFDFQNNQWVLLGKTAGAPYICTATIADPPVGTSRTVPASITGSLDALSIAQSNSGRMVASWTTQTKVAYSDDGITWTASTTSLTSGSYIVRWTDGVFVAYDMTASGNVYVSTDGITWSTSGVARARTGGSSGLSRTRNFAAMNGIFVVIDSSTSDPLFIYFSNDKCATWKRSSLRSYIGAADYNSASCIRGVNRRLLVFASSGAASTVLRSRKIGLRNSSG